MAKGRLPLVSYKPPTPKSGDDGGGMGRKDEPFDSVVSPTAPATGSGACRSQLGPGSTPGCAF